MLDPSVQRASFVPIGALLAKQARTRGDQNAVRTQGAAYSYRELDARVSRLANHLLSKGLVKGDRVAILSENSGFFLELVLASARIGCILCTLNWRLSENEINYCIGLVSPKVTFVSERYRTQYPNLGGEDATVIDPALVAGIEAMPSTAPEDMGEAEDGCLIIYTSGTTGFPKAALISQRALLARLHVQCIDYGINSEDTFLCWSPMFHTAALELGIGSLLIGGRVVVSDKLDFEQMCDLLENEHMSNLIFFPGMVDEVIAKLEARRPKVKRLKKFGALADLFPPSRIARLTQLMNTPYMNTFGMTEAGMAPASAGRIPIGTSTNSLPKLESCLCDVRVVDEENCEVENGKPGELVLRGPMLFSGYWNDPEATRDAFRGGWYHTGDIFVREEGGALTYIGRRKYLIKSGGENIYPAEIERVILADPELEDAIVIARKDDTWGEVPVAVVAARQGEPDVTVIARRCAEQLARYKRPKEIHVVASGFFPRNNTGKIIRKEIEAWLDTQPVTPIRTDEAVQGKA